MVIKYNNIYHSKALQNLPEIWDFWFENKPSGNPALSCPREIESCSPLPPMRARVGAFVDDTGYEGSDVFAALAFAVVVQIRLDLKPATTYRRRKEETGRYARFFLVQLPKNGKMYTKLPTKYVYQRVIKYTKIFHIHFPLQVGSEVGF
jgi:hypothetical protein